MRNYNRRAKGCRQPVAARRGQYRNPIERDKASSQYLQELLEMLTRLSTWRATRRRKECAIQRAIQQFREKSGRTPMGAFVLHLSPEETIVRVMYMTNHIPPDRAWFAVSEKDASVRELTFRDVAGLEKPWR